MRQRHGVPLQRVGDRLVEQVRDLHLEQQGDERQAQRGEQRLLVGHDDRPRTSDPRLALVRIDRRPRRAVAGLDPDGNERGRCAWKSRRGGPRPSRSRRRSFVPTPGPRSAGPACGAVGVERLSPGLEPLERRRRAVLAVGGDVTQTALDLGVCRCEQTAPLARSGRGRSVAGRPLVLARYEAADASPSITPVTLGRLTASFSASADAASCPSASSASTRYWGRVRSTVAAASSTWRASRAITWPGWEPAGASARTGAAVPRADREDSSAATPLG